MKPLFITGIGTDVGKTIVSAVLTSQLRSDYWKPVQAGDLDFTDGDKVRALTGPQAAAYSTIHPERFRFKLPASPHKAARAEGIKIGLQDFKLPETRNRLLIEGAGGLFVPLSDQLLMIDLIGHFKADVVLVTRNYLGCINHTLLSIHALESKNIALKHLVFNGSFDEDTFRVILNYLPEGCTWSSLPELETVSMEGITTAPVQLKNDSASTK